MCGSGPEGLSHEELTHSDTEAKSQSLWGGGKLGSQESPWRGSSLIPRPENQDPGGDDVPSRVQRQEEAEVPI